MVESYWRCTDCGEIATKPGEASRRNDHGAWVQIEIHPIGTEAELERLRAREKRLSSMLGRSRKYMLADDWPGLAEFRALLSMQEERDD